MCDCVASFISSPFTIQKLGFNTGFQFCNFIPKLEKNYTLSAQSTRNWLPFSSDEYEFLENRDLGFKSGEDGRKIRAKQSSESVEKARKFENSALRNGMANATDSSSFKDVLNRGISDSSDDDSKLAKDDYLAKPEAFDSDFEEGENVGAVGVVRMRSGRQMMRRCNVMAKQVISIRSALSMGFLSQLWVDTSNWVVLVVEVRTSLLSGDFERFLLEDIKQVGDVILIDDKNVMENEFKSSRLETLVGYTVVTPDGVSIGKVRGYSFNVNSGAVESLELDSFGISIIPSSLVSTYALFAEDVLEVFPDMVIVHEAAVSRIQRLTKGFGVVQNATTDESDEYPQANRQRSQARRRRRRKLSSRKSQPIDDWELPIDYL